MKDEPVLPRKSGKKHATWTPGTAYYVMETITGQSTSKNTQNPQRHLTDLARTPFTGV